MIYVNEAYKSAVEKYERNSYIIVKYGQYDKEIKGKIDDVENQNVSLFSNVNKTYNDIKETTKNYITCEPNRVKLDNTFCFIFNKNNSNNSEDIASYGNILTNEQGYFNDNNDYAGYEITYNFNSDCKTSNVVLYFQEVCTKLEIVYYYNSDIKYSKLITNNDSKKVIFEIPKEEIDKIYNKLVIKVYSTQEPYRFVKFNEIDFGNIETFSNNQIIDLEIIDELDLFSNELSSNSLNLVINDINKEYDFLNPNNKLSKLQEQQELSVSII